MGSGYIVQRGGGKDYSAFKTFVDRSITEVTAEMLDGATEIGNSAFYNCRALKSIKYRGTEEQWRKISKGDYWDFNTGRYEIIYNYTGE